MPGETTGSSLAMRTAYKQIASAAAAGTPWKHMRQDPRRIRSDRCFGVGSMISSTQPAGSNRGVAFWMVFASNLLVDMLSALDLTAISTALPTIVDHLHGTDFIWAGSAYTIASTAILPLIGNLVSAFGRKPSLVAFILTFALGSAISGAAQNMNMLIAGRTVQGLGGGGCIAITEIIYADLVPLPERGKFQGITASVWAFACAVGPPIGGALADSGAWRWLFFLNLPLCGLAVILTTIFLRVHTPRASFTEKITQMDWTGISVMIGSTISILLAITWGGLQFPWASGHVLAPLIIGAIGILTFFVLEMLWLKGPTTQFAIDYLPVYFQATKGASAVGSGVDLFPLCLTIPAFAIATGLSVQIIDRYRPQNYIGWAFIIVGFGVLGILDENSSRAAYIGSQVPLGVGLGIIWISTQFPILAPLPYSNSAHALAFFTFMRCFAQSWGIVVGGTILQNELLKNLPDAFRAQFPGGVQIAYAVIPAISSLPATLKDEVRAVFARATRLIWQVMIGVSGAGLLSVFLMREEKLRQDMDEQWGLREDGLGPASLQSQNELEWKVADAADVELAQVPPAERK
ncbi:iron permease [Cubamyces menziesii]|nr:iron permease [Cubamyces menziesii]